MKICRICTPYKFAQSGGIPPKIICKIFVCKGSQTTRATPGDNREFKQTRRRRQQERHIKM